MQKHSQRALIMIWILLAMAFFIDLIYELVGVFYMFLAFVFLALVFVASFYNWIKGIKKKK
tara:strand:+ start:274 stop:456 length:183 start_codon:yes stop_codon:yes gene_type:complete